ncbi:MAG: hypothetical protein WB679_25865, partial [Terracidiphilus sp.]
TLSTSPPSDIAAKPTAKPLSNRNRTSSHTLRDAFDVGSRMGRTSAPLSRQLRDGVCVQHAATSATEAAGLPHSCTHVEHEKKTFFS